MTNGSRVEINSPNDIVNARQRGRAMAQKLGFDSGEVTLVAAAISEVARNIVDFARQGEIIIKRMQSSGKLGIEIVARDSGPGIPDIAQAMRYGYSTRNSLGGGLPGAKWLMDEFDVKSTVGKGTKVTMKKWARASSAWKFNSRSKKTGFDLPKAFSNQPR